MDKIRSNKYFDAVKTYSGDHKDPAIVYRFLMETLQTDKHLLYEEMLYRRVDMFETVDDCVRFYTGTECTLTLCPQPEKNSKGLSEN